MIIDSFSSKCFVDWAGLSVAHPRVRRLTIQVGSTTAAHERH